MSLPALSSSCSLLDLDSFHGASGNPPHQMCDTAHYLVSELPAGDYGDLLACNACWCGSHGPARVVLLHDEPGCLPRGLGANTAHLGGSLAKEET